MKAPPFRYHRPASVAEAVNLLATLDDARPLAGGQSLMPMLNLRIAAPAHLVDLGGVEELAGVEETGGALRIGAMTTQRALERSQIVARACPLLAEAVRLVGHQQTRNRGTMGGSLCHLDPGAELPVVAAALGARMMIAGPSGSRIIPFSDFATGYLSTSLAPGELLTHVEWPVLPERAGSAFLEFNRRPADFAIVSVAAQIVLDAEGGIARAAVALGGSFEKPVRLRAAEAAMAGQAVGDAAFDLAAEAAAALACDGDAVYPAEYRRELGAELVRRALARAAERAREPAHA